MISQEITALRKDGKLDEALQLTYKALEDDSENIWNKRAASWVYYVHLKSNSDPSQYETFKSFLLKIIELDLPDDEKMVFDTCAWQIGKMVYALTKNSAPDNIVVIDYAKVDELFDLVKKMPFTKPSESYSFLYRAFHKSHKSWSKFLEFADWWGFENFREEDYAKEVYKGNMMPPTAELAYLAYAKKLLEGESDDPAGLEHKINKEKIRSFLPRLEALIEEHPSYQYPPYYKAKLLIALGDEENGLDAFMPFAKKKRNDFWVWDLMADMYSGDLDMQFACYCKALSLKTPSEYLVNVRQKFARLLIEKKMYEQANIEIQQLCHDRGCNSYKIPNEVLGWMEQPWFELDPEKSNDLEPVELDNTLEGQIKAQLMAHFNQIVTPAPSKSNDALYKAHLEKAEELLFTGTPEEILVVEFVNRNKFMLNFIKDKTKHGFFKYKGYLNDPKVGDLLRVRFTGESKDGFHKVLSVKPAEPDDQTSAMQAFEGTLQINGQNSFGFVDDVYVGAKLIEKSNLQNDAHVKGRAILSFNTKRDEWSWKAFEVVA